MSHDTLIAETRQLSKLKFHLCLASKSTSIFLSTPYLQQGAFASTSNATSGEHSSLDKTRNFAPDPILRQMQIFYELTITSRFIPQKNALAAVVRFPTFSSIITAEFANARCRQPLWGRSHTACLTKELNKRNPNLKRTVNKET
jgi:hypothetical protein